MKQKFSCIEAFNHFMALDAALRNNNVQYPASAIINGSRNRKRLSSELEEYEKYRNEKINEFGTDGYINSNNPKFKDFLEAMEEYNKVEIEVEIAMVSISDFMQFSYRPDELMPFEFMIE